MNIRITDLLDYYRGEPVKIKQPMDATGKQDVKPNSTASQSLPHRGRRPLQIAAALLLVVTTAAAIPFALSKASGNSAMTQGSAPVEASDSMEEEAREQIPCYTITGAKVRESYTFNEYGARCEETFLYENNIRCHGNIINIDGDYYTITEDGPAPLETTRLQTTIELYGTWELNMDYSIIDGELAYRALNYVGEPGTAYPYPLNGSPDTVMLSIKRTDLPSVEGLSYPVFYNVLTGEITDPLANVPELFDHDCFSSADFNNSLTRAIVHTARVENSRNNVSFITTDYVCDLATGEMTAVSDLAGPYMPESDNPETKFSVWSDDCMWADDDTLLYYIWETTPNGNEDPMQSNMDSCFWLYAYDMTTASIRYYLQDLETPGLSIDQPYIQLDYDGVPHVIDAVTGTVYSMEWLADYSNWDTTPTRTIYYCTDREAYLLDFQRMGWVKLSDYMSLPDPDRENPNNIFTTARFLTEDILCLMTEDTVYCYRIPDNLELTPLTEK